MEKFGNKYATLKPWLTVLFCVQQIRNVLDLMRRGEGLRFEVSFNIFFFGVHVIYFGVSTNKVLGFQKSEFGCLVHSWLPSS